jgi:Phosphomannomutase
LEDSSGRYSEYLKSTLDKKINFRKFKIVLDCANGATYQVAPNLFWELGHEVISINSNPDGTNINKNCGAVEVSGLKRTVLKKRADIGFAFDGDGDRLIVVDEKGNEVNGDKIIALFAKNFIGLKNKLENNKVITTTMSNLGFEKYLQEELNISLVRTDVGDINVINAMQKNKSLLGGEQSGHIILSEYSNTGDGILAALKIIEIMSKKNDKTSKIFNLYNEFPQKKINIKYKKVNKNIRKKIISLSLNKSNNTLFYRSLIRFSGTEPLIRILVEGTNKKEVSKIAKKFEDKVRSILV